MASGMNLLIILFFIGSAYSGNDEPETIPESTNSSPNLDLASSSSPNVQYPQDEKSLLFWMMLLPKSTITLILGNFEAVPSNTRMKMDLFSKYCSSETTLQSVQDYGETIALEILTWKFSEERNSNKLDQVLDEYILLCSNMNAKLGQGTIPSEIHTKTIGNPGNDCVENSDVKKLLQEIKGKELLCQINEVIRGLPFIPCARMRIINHSFIQSYLESTVEQKTEENDTQLATSLRIIFSRFIEWYEIMLRNKEEAAPVIRDKYSYQPDNKHLPPLDVILRSVPPKEHTSYQENWRILVIILNLPVDIDPIILGNIHFTPLSMLVKMLSGIVSVRTQKNRTETFLKEQRQIIDAILEMKSALSNFLSNPFLSVKYNPPTTVLIDAIRSWDENWNTGAELGQPNYVKIGDFILCLNTGRHVKNIEIFKNIFKQESFSNKDMLAVTALLPAESCGWVSVILFMIIGNYAKDDADSNKIHRNLMNYFNDITTYFERIFRIQKATEERRILIRPKENASSKRKMEDTGAEFKRPADKVLRPVGETSASVPTESMIKQDQINMAGSQPYTTEILSSSEDESDGSEEEEDTERNSESLNADANKVPNVTGASEEPQVTDPNKQSLNEPEKIDLNDGPQESDAYMELSVSDTNMKSLEPGVTEEPRETEENMELSDSDTVLKSQEPDVEPQEAYDSIERSMSEKYLKFQLPDINMNPEEADTNEEFQVTGANSKLPMIDTNMKSAEPDVNEEAQETGAMRGPPVFDLNLNFEDTDANDEPPMTGTKNNPLTSIDINLPPPKTSSNEEPSEIGANK